MQGYDPDRRQQNEAGGCREAFLITRIAFEILLPPIGLIAATIILLTFVVILATTNPLLALIPLAPIAGGIVWLVRRDRRVQREMEDEVRGKPRK